MNTDKELLFRELTGEIIKSAYQVHNTLGCGLLEKVYENALAWDLSLKHIKVSNQEEYIVLYKEKETEKIMGEIYMVRIMVLGLV